MQIYKLNFRKTNIFGFFKLFVEFFYFDFCYLLNILHWYGTIPDDAIMLRKRSIESYTSNKAITLHGKVTKASSGYLELGHINISVADSKLKEGDFVAYNKNAKKYIKLAYDE